MPEAGGKAAELGGDAPAEAGAAEEDLAVVEVGEAACEQDHEGVYDREPVSGHSLIIVRREVQDIVADAVVRIVHFVLVVRECVHEANARALDSVDQGRQHEQHEAPVRAPPVNRVMVHSTHLRRQNFHLRRRHFLKFMIQKLLLPRQVIRADLRRELEVRMRVVSVSLVAPPCSYLIEVHLVAEIVLDDLRSHFFCVELWRCLLGAAVGLHGGGLWLHRCGVEH